MSDLIKDDGSHGVTFLREPAMQEPQRFHPLVFVAFLLAVLVLVLPTQADLVFAAVTHGDFLVGILIVVGSFLLVVTPLLIARRAVRVDPYKWKPRILMPVTWGIVIANVLMNVTIFLSVLTKAK